MCDVTPIYGCEIFYCIPRPEMSFTLTERMRKSDVNGNFLILYFDFTTSLSRWMLVLNQLQDMDIHNHQFNRSDVCGLNIISLPEALSTGSALCAPEVLEFVRKKGSSINNGKNSR